MEGEARSPGASDGTGCSAADDGAPKGSARSGAIAKLPLLSTGEVLLILLLAEEGSFRDTEK